MTQKHVALRYGKDKLTLPLPDVSSRCAVLKAPLPPGDVLSADKVVQVLENPINKGTFVSLFDGGEKVTIVTPDLTRYSGAEIYLPVMLDALNEAKVSDSDITVVFANGIHRRQTEDEKEQLVGRKVAGRVKLLDHDSKSSDLAPLNVEALDQKVYVNRLAVECDKLIITGVVGYHYLAGFGGGGKAVMPGLASFEDASRFHYLSLSQDHTGRDEKAWQELSTGTQ